MAESADLGHAVGPLTVPDRQLRDLHVQSRRAEEQVKIAERVEVAEERPTLCDLLVVSAQECLGPAEGVLDPLLQDPGKGQAEKLVADQIQRPHGLSLHGVNEP